MANEYVERQLTSGTPRSYAGGKAEDGVDALDWSSSGFIWDLAEAHGKTFRNYGEWMISDAGWTDSKRKGKLSWRDFWTDFQSGAGAVQLRSHAGLEGFTRHSHTNTVGWELRVPDVMRAAEFIRELHRFETNGGFPDLVLLFLPNDHTGGTRGEDPAPGAQVADNDLALGRVVEALSHSRFWPETCVFAIEDDPQAGWDHVSGYRTICFVASPYTRRRQTISTQYNQISLVRTIELILGLPPMNQMDATAAPMADCFTNSPDFAPFNSVANQVPLDRINPAPRKITNRQLRRDALASSRLPLDAPDRLSRGPAQPDPLARHERPRSSLSRVGRAENARRGLARRASDLHRLMRVGSTVWSFEPFLRAPPEAPTRRGGVPSRFAFAFGILIPTRLSATPPVAPGRCAPPAPVPGRLGFRQVRPHNGAIPQVSVPVPRGGLRP